MKKLKLNGKLSLNKQTIAKLNDNEAKSIMGGATMGTCNVGTQTTCVSATCTGRLC